MRLDPLRIALAIGVAAFVITAIYIASLLFERQTALEPVGRGNISWMTAQSPSEYARLEQRISAYGLSGSGIDRAEVEMRFDIISNRLQTLHSSALALFIASDQRNVKTLAALDDAVSKARALLGELDVEGTPVRMLEPS
ncbi:hypothetical protein PSQ19_18425 [Devosia algicola]|uniref:Uncharacterized protein n=1 Tax=Devosia algicola TaxID=3026418 RepID=A0ABY7YMP4_9HYPH|nr:hypothetical protein [Devosia algicola]WDR02536.1 hypothetical protein PSQ19_18425 [Devosia algicola]